MGILARPRLSYEPGSVYATSRRIGIRDFQIKKSSKFSCGGASALRSQLRAGVPPVVACISAGCDSRVGVPPVVAQPRWASCPPYIVGRAGCPSHNIENLIFGSL